MWPIKTQCEQHDLKQLTFSYWIAFLAPSSSTTNLRSLSQLPFSKSETCTATFSLLPEQKQVVEIKQFK
jgi:hypothetical protein